jgi:hypothetical protein
MYELSRVRLHTVGPRGARYQDVTLDLRGAGPAAGSSLPAAGDRPRRPSPATVLFLENGGGKTVLVKLIFSVMLPGRRQVVATSSTRALQKFVLADDVAHVTLEWLDAKSGQLLVTGKVSEWQGHAVSADPRKFTERWYSFRPAPDFGLSDLPFTQDGRLVTLGGFYERMAERQRANPALQFVWEKGRGDWTEHLEGLHLDPELFAYQRKMNAGEGEAADAFTFKTDEAFIDWLLTAIIPDEEPESLGEVVTGYGRKLAMRGDLMAERDFVEGALDRLGPLAHAARERAAAIDIHKDARGDAQRLALALAARHDQEAETLRLLNGQLADVEARERTCDQEVRRLNAVVLELSRLVAGLRWEAATQERTQLERQRDDARKLLSAWLATNSLVRYHAAREKAAGIRLIVEQQEVKAKPALHARDLAAARFARGLLAVAAAADAAASSADTRAGELDEAITHTGDKERAAIRDAEAANAQIEQATQAIAAVQEAVRAAVATGLLADYDEVVAEAASMAEADAGDAESEASAALTRSGELAAGREEAAAELDAAREDEKAKADTARALSADLTEARRGASELSRNSRLADLLGSEDVILDSDMPTLLDVLTVAIGAAEQEQAELRGTAAADERVLEALGSGGLLPPSNEIVAALDVLADRNIIGWSGWRYLASIRADERDAVLARYPHLVDGIVLNSSKDLDRAREELTAARLLPGTIIAVGTSTAITAADAPHPAGVAFIVPPNPAMYDEEQAKQERLKIQIRQEARSGRLQELGTEVARDRDLHSRLTQWGRAYPPGRVDKLASDHEHAASELHRAQEALQGKQDSHGKLTAAEKELRRQLPRMHECARQARAKAAQLAALAAECVKVPRWEETIRTARAEITRADKEAEAARAKARELTRQQLAAHREADSHRRTVADCRDQLAEVTGAGAVDMAVEPPDEPLESLRAAFKAAQAAYEKVEVGADLLAELGRAEDAESGARADIERLEHDIRQLAEELLRTPDGTSAGARDAATARAGALADGLDYQVTAAVEEVARLKQVYDSYQPQERSLEPYGRPRDIPHGEELIASATADRDGARKAFEDAQGRKEALTREAARTDRLMNDFGAVGESLAAIVTPEPGNAAGAFPGTIDDARTTRDSVRETLNEAARLLEDATRQVRTAADALAQHATDERFEKAAAPIRRHMIATDRERLPDFAEQWESALRPRFRVLTDELHQIERHRSAIIERLQGMVTHALGRLRAAQRASRLPAGLGDWSGLEFLRIGFTQPEEAVLAERLGQVLDEAVVKSADQERTATKRDGLSLVLNGVRASFRPKGVRVDMLKPDAVLRDERVRVAEISEVFSGGQLLTAAIILYCTMAWLRASERGYAQRPHAGVLFLDNPIGRASAGYLLELQIAVADKLGVQLIYTTGLFDTNALSVFPLIIRLRNDADLRAGMKYLRVDEEMRARLPAEPSDGTGVLTASRLFVRPGAQTA